MIVAINYNTDRTPYIAKIMFDINWDYRKEISIANEATNVYDQVYYVDSFSQNDKDFIQEIQLHAKLIK